MPLAAPRRLAAAAAALGRETWIRSLTRMPGPAEELHMARGGGKGPPPPRPSLAWRRRQRPRAPSQRARSRRSLGPGRRGAADLPMQQLVMEDGGVWRGGGWGEGGGHGMGRKGGGGVDKVSVWTAGRAGWGGHERRTGGTRRARAENGGRDRESEREAERDRDRDRDRENESERASERERER